MRFLSGRPVTVEHEFVDDEVSLSVTEPVGYVLRDAAAVEVASGTAAADAGVYTASLGRLTQGAYSVEFSDASGDYVDVVGFEVTGGRLVSVTEVRQEDVDLEASRFPASAVARAREQVEAEFQRITGRSFVPRTARVTFDAYGQDVTWLGLFDTHALVSVQDAAGDAVTASLVLDGDGMLSGLHGLADGVYTATVDYGFRHAPADVRRAAAQRVGSVLLAPRSAVPDRAVSFQPTDGGNYTLATAGRAGWETGIPDVDAVLKRYRHSVLTDVLGVG